MKMYGPTCCIMFFDLHTATLAPYPVSYNTIIEFINVTFQLKGYWLLIRIHRGKKHIFLFSERNYTGKVDVI